MSQPDTRARTPDEACLDHDPQGWRQETRDLLRALAGGALVGIPLLYTMEVWHKGLLLDEWHLLIILSSGFAINFLFSLLSGFRRRFSIGTAASEATTAIALGLLFSGAVLALIGELEWSAKPLDTLGKLIVAGVGVSLGASFANSQVAGKSRTGDDNNGNARPTGGNAGSDDQSPEKLQLGADLADAGATVAGATVFTLNIAPTEEVILIAARLSPWQQITLLAASVAICYIILFASGFEVHQVYVESVFQNPLAETVMTTALSLLVAFGLLALIGSRELLSHPSTAIAGVITLGFPAVVGGAAGRLII